jgi:hypothetical protein
VCLVVVSLSRVSTYFSLTALLVLCEHLFSLGLAFWRPMPILFVITLFSSLSQLEVFELVGLFFSSFG